MAWIKKVVDVVVDNEMEFSGANRIAETNAYEVEITEAYLQDSKADGSKSSSLVIEVKNEDGATAKTFFTITGKDGQTFFTSTAGGKTVKKQHFGLSIANTLFKLLLDKEIFDAEPTGTTYKKWNKESKELETLEADGFPELIGKKIGTCIQMIRKISGKDSSEYPEITHFFNIETGLFADEEQSDKRKLDRWLASAKDFKVIEEEAPKTSFGKKAEKTEDTPVKKKWGK